MLSFAMVLHLVLKKKARVDVSEVLIGVIMLIYGFYLFLKDFKYMLFGVILMFASAFLLGIGLKEVIG